MFRQSVRCGNSTITRIYAVLCQINVNVEQPAQDADTGDDFQQDQWWISFTLQPYFAHSTFVFFSSIHINVIDINLLMVVVDVNVICPDDDDGPMR